MDEVTGAVSAILAAAGFAFLIYQHRHAQSERKAKAALQEHERRLLVTGWANLPDPETDGYYLRWVDVHIYVRNGTEQQITRVTVRLHLYDQSHQPLSLLGAMPLNFDAIGPGLTVEGTLGVQYEHGPARYVDVDVYYTDSTGRHWLRRGATGVLEERPAPSTWQERGGNFYGW